MINTSVYLTILSMFLAIGYLSTSHDYLYLVLQSCPKTEMECPE